MALELEYKLRVERPETLDAVLSSEMIAPLLAEEPRTIVMRTEYFDTPDRALAAARITFRRRMENDVSVVCVKAPMPGMDFAKTRDEWELEADDALEALPRLVALGAPEELLSMTAGGVACTCRAAFTRRAALLRLPDGSACELALDLGKLCGPTETAPLCELELELKHGPADATADLAARLCAAFGLRPEKKSKLARAKALK